MVSSVPDGGSQTSDIAAGTVYNLTDTVYVEARIVNNTDKFISSVSLQKLYFFFNNVTFNFFSCITAMPLKPMITTMTTN